MMKPYRIKVCGKAGDGIISTSELFFNAAADCGYHVSIYKSIPSSIRYGNTNAIVSLSDTPVSCHTGNIDCTIIVNDSKLHSNSSDTNNNAIRIICSPQIKQVAPSLDISYNSTIILPVYKFKPFSSTNFLLGALTHLFNISLSAMSDVISLKFNKKTELIDDILHNVNSGYKWATENLKPVLSPVNCNNSENRECLDGNQALCKGIIDAGCNFFSSYPITPATSIGDTLSVLLRAHDGKAYQAEDEIAAIGSVCGASFSGVKALTATSGPGFSLMQEFISYMCAAEIPGVIIDVMRCGSSTGIPTHHAQEDLLSAVFGGHGEHTRIVLAPSSIANCYHTVIESFNCSEYYSCPVILLSSAALAFGAESINTKDLHPLRGIIDRNNSCRADHDSPFARYDESNLLSPFLPSPGDSFCTYVVTGLEHDSFSMPSESPDVHKKELTKRANKTLDIESKFSHLIEWDLEESSAFGYDFSIAAWGSDVMPVKAAVKSLRSCGYRIAALYPQLIFPLCSEAFQKLLDCSYLLIIPESNFSGQYSQLIRMKLGISPVSITFSDGEPINPDILESELKSMVTKRYRND